MNTSIDTTMIAAGLVTWLIVLSGLMYLLYDRVKKIEETIRKKKRPPH